MRGAGSCPEGLLSASTFHLDDLASRTGKDVPTRNSGGARETLGHSASEEKTGGGALVAQRSGALQSEYRRTIPSLRDGSAAPAQGSDGSDQRHGCHHCVMCAQHQDKQNSQNRRRPTAENYLSVWHLITLRVRPPSASLPLHTLCPRIPRQGART